MKTKTKLGILPPTGIDTALSSHSNAWLGTEDGLSMLSSIQKRISEASPELIAQAKLYEKDMEHEDESAHWMVDIEEETNIAVISVKGPMVTGRTGFWGSYFGFCGYEDIVDAVEDSREKGCAKILMHYDTNGGSAEGIEGISNYLRDVAKECHLWSFTQSKALSAGLWLFTTSHPNTSCTTMANIGSLGVIAVHATEFRALQLQGVDTEVFRSVPGKAPGSPYEKMNELARDTINADITKLHGFFSTAISENLSLPLPYVEENLATGAVWYGEDAKNMGLVKNVATFKEVFLALAAINVDNTTNYNQNSGAGMSVNKKVKVVTEQAAAAISAGIPVEIALQDIEVVEGQDIEVDTTLSLNGQEPAKVEEVVKFEAVETATELAVDTVSTKLMDQLIDTKVALHNAQAKIASMEASFQGMKEVVAAKLQCAQVGLGGAAQPMESLLSMDASALLAQFNQVDSQLSARLGAGKRVSIQVDDSDDEKHAIDVYEEHLRAASVEAARIRKPK